MCGLAAVVRQIARDGLPMMAAAVWKPKAVLFSARLTILNGCFASLG
jgi:hypothetical protein